VTTRRTAIVGGGAGGAAGVRGVGEARSARADAELAARLRLVVARLGRTVRQHAAAGLTPSQLSALASVEEHDSIRISDLAGCESVGAPVMTRVVDSLEKLGYVGRVADPSDGRACLIELTDGGRAVLAELWSTRTAVLSKRLARLPRSQVDALAGALPALEALVRDPGMPG
jgi:DNA-binding MarR family transcriptional regulator